jgi:hypothetical protein
MAWAGAVNQEYLDSELHPNQQEQGQQEPTTWNNNRFVNRRASIDAIISTTPPTDTRQRQRRCHSNDDIDDIEVNEGQQGQYLDDVSGDGDDDLEGNKSRLAERRNSLHAMVERAMAFVNLRKEPYDDDLCPFGTRRDSLF